MTFVRFIMLVAAIETLVVMGCVSQREHPPAPTVPPAQRLPDYPILPPATKAKLPDAPGLVPRDAPLLQWPTLTVHEQDERKRLGIGLNEPLSAIERTLRQDRWMIEQLRTK